MIPLLGKEGKDFVKNLKVLNDMVQRELGALPSEGVTRAIKGGDYKAGANLEGARMLQRLLIAPLTQTGRRTTAISGRMAENSRKMIGEMLLDEKLFKETMRMAQGRETTQRFIRFLSAYGLVVTQDLASEMEFYDTTEKLQKTPEKKEIVRDMTPSRVLEIYDEL